MGEEYVEGRWNGPATYYLLLTVTLIRMAS